MKSTNSFEAIISFIIERNPLLQISIPEFTENSTENWDELEYTPLVAVLPDDYNEQKTKEILAYDMNGNEFYLDAKIEPNHPVIVIGKNERLIAIKKKGSLKSAKMPDEACYEPYYETRQYEYLIPIDCGYYGGGSEDMGSGAGSSGITSFDRDKNNNPDMLDRAKFVSKTSFRQVEGWPTGRPEFKVIISYIEKIGDNYQTKAITKILTKDDWISRYGFWVNLKTKKIHLPILVWDKTKYGDSFKYTWIEQDDSSKKVELSISTSSKFGGDSNSTITGSTKVTITPEDDEAGEAVVRYDDATAGVGTEYNTGIVKFWVNQ